MPSSLPGPRCYGRRVRTGPALLLIALLATARDVVKGAAGLGRAPYKVSGVA